MARRLGARNCRSRKGCHPLREFPCDFANVQTNLIKTKKGLGNAETLRAAIPSTKSPKATQRYCQNLRYERIPAIHPEVHLEFSQAFGQEMVLADCRCGSSGIPCAVRYSPLQDGVFCCGFRLYRVAVHGEGGSHCLDIHGLDIHSS